MAEVAACPNGLRADQYAKRHVFCGAGSSSVARFLNRSPPAPTWLSFPPSAPPEPHYCKSIGQFYEAIELGFAQLSTRGSIFTGDPAGQVTAAHYCGGGGEIIDIFEPGHGPLNQSIKAFAVIVGLGEAVCDTVVDADQIDFGQEVSTAHYFRFNEINEGGYYAID